ncbi:hypothetical protein [Gorillibacterium sp. CAU 1737]|uniref:hypothetical protein n=1 Tax=Gorillibacterium sp. CAU 1737 TaxID=3140362 RepID=UPI00325FED68
MENARAVPLTKPHRHNPKGVVIPMREPSATYVIGNTVINIYAPDDPTGEIMERIMQNASEVAWDILDRLAAEAQE